MWQCEEMGLPYEVKKVSFPPSPEYLALHSLGSVPFLEDEGGVAIHESIAIMLHLAHRYGPTPLLPMSDPATHARVLQLVVFSEATLGASINTLLAAHFAAPEVDKKNWSVSMSESRCAQGIEWLEKKLGDRPFLVGDGLTIADLAITTTLAMWKSALDKPLPERITKWRETLAARPAYARAAEKAHG